jgi:hypothetical protein
MSGGSKQGFEIEQVRCEHDLSLFHAIAEAEARLARLRTQSRRLDNGQKIIWAEIIIGLASSLRI